MRSDVVMGGEGTWGGVGVMRERERDREREKERALGPSA